MTRLFVDYKLPDNGEFSVSGDDAHYLISVLRLNFGEMIKFVDSTGDEVLAEFIGQSGKNEARFVVGSRQRNSSEPLCKVTLFQSVSKGERMDLTIQKSVELGVDKIVPVFSERCVVSRGKDFSSKVERWQKIALEAARQSGRGKVPMVSMPMDLKEAVIEAKSYDLRLIPWEEEHGVTLKQALESSDIKENSTIAVFIGPEGGFGENEASLCENEAGALAVTLGPRILRTETAGPTVLAMILYKTEL